MKEPNRARPSWSQSDGVLLQDLPFSVELKKFIVEHYSHAGMPKLFCQRGSSSMTRPRVRRFQRASGEPPGQLQGVESTSRALMMADRP